MCHGTRGWQCWVLSVGSLWPSVIAEGRAYYQGELMWQEKKLLRTWAGLSPLPLYFQGRTGIVSGTASATAGRPQAVKHHSQAARTVIGAMSLKSGVMNATDPRIHGSPSPIQDGPSGGKICPVYYSCSQIICRSPEAEKGAGMQTCPVASLSYQELPRKTLERC